MDKRLKILIVEDSPGDTMLIRDALEDEEKIHEIDNVNNGEKAINYLKQEGEFVDKSKPSLVLLDVNLPRVNGHEVLHFIKNNDGTKELPVIMLSSSSSETDIRESYQQYANCYIVKPIGMANFAEAIENIKDFWFNLCQLPEATYRN
jgi:CheY-like chemotaxis protein